MQGTQKITTLSMLLTLLFGMVVMQPVLALSDDEREEKQQQLEQLKDRIQSLQKDMQSTQAQQTEVQQLLQKTERQIGERVKEIRRIQTQLNQKRRELTTSQRRQDKLKRTVATNQDLLAEQIRASYIIGHQEYLKLLLNQSDPATAGRMVKYYDYFNNARQDHILESRKAIEELVRLDKKITAQKQHLNVLHQAQLKEKQTLDGIYSERKQVLVQLTHDLKNKDQQLSALKEDQKQLQALLARIQRAVNEVLPDEPLLKQHAFNDLRGRLTWPSAGQVKKLFGQSRESGKLRWNGVLIDANQGTNVHAVARGRVAYAEWLRGYGLLVILDHGDGYMSLYGHNQSIFKGVGDWVEPGEVIASVGNSGGQADTSLYFEIRENGKPRDPSTWCRRRRS